MGTVLVYLVIAAVVAVVVFLLASLIFGRGEELAPLPSDATPTWLPNEHITGHDVRAVRFAQVLRGYRMTEVDWTLQRVAAELDELRARVAELEADAALNWRRNMTGTQHDRRPYLTGGDA